MGYTVKKSSITEPEPKRGGIAWHIENTLVRFIKRIFNDLADGMIELVSKAFLQFMEELEPEFISMVSPTLNKLKDTPGIPDELKDLIDKSQEKTSAVQLAAAIPLLLAGLWAALSGPISVLTRIAAYQTDNLVHSARIDPITGYNMVRRGVLDNERLERDMRNLGWNEVYYDAFKEITHNLLEPSTLTTALYRGEIDETSFRNTLKKKGYENDDIETIISILPVIPGVGDLIRMAVREAFNDQVANRFGYDEDYPAEFGEWTDKQGLSAEWAKRFWRAHWELPGVRDAFEMLHRRIINDDELKDLLRAKDIPVFWRNALIELSYSPYTRVDVRRMYQAGTIDEDEVYETYRDIGYNDEKATKLTNWTIDEYTQNELELTKSDIFNSLVDGVIRETEAREYFEAIGRKELEIDLLIARANLKKQEEFEKELIKNVRVSYVAGVIDDNDVFSQLSAIDPPSGFIDERLKVWRIQKQRGVKRPTITNLRDFWLAGVIDENRLRQEMSGIGVPDLYTDLYIRFWSLKAEE